MQTFINMMDTIMVGRLGAVEISAVGLGNQIFFMLNMILFGISSGGSVFIAQFWGAKDFGGIRKTFGLMLFLSLLISLAFSVGGIFFPRQLIGLYTADAEVIAAGAEYLKIAAMSYILMAITFSCQMAFRSTEHIMLPTVTTAISFLLNIFFNRIFIFGVSLPFVTIPAFGAAGAAVGTLISRTVEFLVTVIYGHSHHFECFGKFKEYCDFSKDFIVRFVKVAIPVICSETLWGLGITTQNSIFSHAGTDSFAAFSIMNTVSQLTWVYFIGTGNASAIILGKKIGAGKMDEAKAYAHRYSWFFPLMGFVVGLLLLPLSRLLPLIFKVSPEIIRIVQSMLLVLLGTYPLRAFNILLIIGICRSGGDTIFSMIIDNGWMWLLAIPLACVATFVLHLPAWQILLCLELEQLFKAICGIFRISSGKWVKSVIQG